MTKKLIYKTDNTGVNKQLDTSEIVQAYEKVKRVVIEDFDQGIWLLTDACLSTIATLLLEDNVNPCGLNLIGSPSCGKTTVLSFFDVEGITYKCDSFTPAAFVSHSSNVKEKELSNIDLLPRIKHKCIIIPELGPIFLKRKEDLVENFAILTRVFDGQGLETDTGSKGRRGYKGDYLFAWLGASTPFDYKVWTLMGKLGSRLVFMNAPNEYCRKDKLNKVLEGLLDKKSYKDKVQECRQAVSYFLEFLWKNTGGVRKVKWNASEDRENLIRNIIALADFVSTCRSTVSVWREKEADYNYNQPIIEDPPRLSAILYNLVRGHAIIQGRTQINEEDTSLVIEIGLCSMPDDRRKVLELLLERELGKPITTEEIVEVLRVSNPTARAIMYTLSVLGVVDYLKGGSGCSDMIKLKKDFEWFQQKIFRELRARLKRI